MSCGAKAGRTKIGYTRLFAQDGTLVIGCRNSIAQKGSSLFGCIAIIAQGGTAGVGYTLHLAQKGRGAVGYTLYIAQKGTLFIGYNHRIATNPQPSRTLWEWRCAMRETRPRGSFTGDPKCSAAILHYPPESLKPLPNSIPKKGEGDLIARLFQTPQQPFYGPVATSDPRQLHDLEAP